MSDAFTTLDLHLKKAGCSLTEPRRLVFSMLQNEGTLNMQQLYSKLEERVNRTTVYRVIQLFEELKIAQRVAHGWKYQLELTDQFVPHHHHFTCIKCNKMISFDEPKSFNVMLETISNHSGFEPTGHTFEIEGLCSDCRA